MHAAKYSNMLLLNSRLRSVSDWWGESPRPPSGGQGRPPHKVIFNADDYGLSPAVSRGILKASTAGLVLSTSVMANLVTEDEVSALRAAASGQWSVGIHLNLSCGAPLCATYPRELLDSKGCFDKDRALKPETWQSAAFRQACAEEWSAQLDFLSQTGLSVDHLDSHHHVHLFEELFPLALELARTIGIALRTRTQAQREAAHTAGIATPDSLLLDFFGHGRIDKASLFNLLAGARGDIVEVVCHPGMVDEVLRGRSGYVEQRAMELETLSDHQLEPELKEQGWEPSGYNWQ